MIKYVKGDLLKANQQLIVHQCNARGIMGSGVARQVKEQYPSVYGKYFDMCDSRPRSKLMGEAQIVQIDDKRSIVNLIGQYHFLPRTQRHTDYNALEKGFKQLKIDRPKVDLAMPKIGCGLGGGDWNIVSQLIVDIFDDRTVYVYEL